MRLGDNMKRKIFYIILGAFLCLTFQEKVLAKEVVKECNYTYVNSMSKDGSTSTQPFAENATINIKIYDDGSHSGNGSGSVGGSETLKNWGTEFNGIPDIKSTTACPDYIVVTSEGFLEASDRWYGVSSSKLIEYGKKLAGLNASSTVPAIIMKNNDLESERPTYTCKYDYYTITVETDQKKLSIKANMNPGFTNLYYHISDELQTNWFSEDRKTDECLTTVACNKGASVRASYYIFNDSMEAASAGYKNCEIKECTGDDCNSSSGTEYSCITYNSYIDDIDSLYSQIENSSGSVDSLYKSVHDKEERLSALCKSVMGNYDFSENCVKACVNLEADIAKIKDNHGIGQSGSNNGSCGLSARIANWIMKIINWMRYIVPVLLIILSVLDFIKAIAADNEDEVKKVTGKFVKRLIVAVVIFLVPLFLEFLLGIFGINTNNFCL